jgi:hypothetical protein
MVATLYGGSLNVFVVVGDEHRIKSFQLGMQHKTAGHGAALQVDGFLTSITSEYVVV